MTLLALLAGCGGIGLDTLVAEPGEAVGTVVVEDITPSWGSPDGGTEVTITGRGFTGAVEVAFGNASVDVVRLDAQTLLVETPEAGVEMPVDVTVRSELGEAVVEDGFTFAEEAPPDDTGGGGGGGGGSADGIGAFIEFSLLQIACPACFGTTSDLEIYANAAFHAPTTRRDWTSWLPDVGSCVVDPVQDIPEGPYLDAGGYVYLNAGSRSVGLRGASSADGITYEAEGIAEAQHARNSGYDLSVPGGPDIEAFDVNDALITPQGFNTITPEQLLLTSSSSAFSARVSRSGQTFTWSPSGGSGTFVILVSVYSPDGSAQLADIVCRDSDDGSMTVPASYLSSYPRNALLAVYFFRYQLDRFDLPSGATGESIASVGVLGTGVLP